MPSVAEFLYQTVDGVFAVDRNQRITFWNSACGQLLGIPAAAARRPARKPTWNKTCTSTTDSFRSRTRKRVAWPAPAERSADTG